MDTALNCFCPSCGAALTPPLGCGDRCLTVAAHLQSARFGTEVSCRACGRHHVVRRINASRELRSSVYLWRSDEVRGLGLIADIRPMPPKISETD